jgi:hypothetical protein
VTAADARRDLTATRRRQSWRRRIIFSHVADDFYAGALRRKAAALNYTCARVPLKAKGAAVNGPSLMLCPGRRQGAVDAAH